MMLYDAQVKSLFRTRAWVQSWVDVWGSDPRIQLIDLGGSGNALEMMYLIEHKLKGVIPVKSLVVAGYGFANFSPPRAEYNNLDSLIFCTGNLENLVREVSALRWGQWVIPDLYMDDDAQILLKNISSTSGLYGVQFRSDISYRITPELFHDYLMKLSQSTRAKYFNRRSRLSKYGNVELLDFSSVQELFPYLNSFHQKRWGRACYSADSMEFFSLFIERLGKEDGIPTLQSLQVNGEVVSVLFDITWRGARYNLQSGYCEDRFGSLALGALHLGYAIEQALSQGLAYDFLAGSGKYESYKEKISTTMLPMNTYCLARGWLKYLYQIHGK